MGSSSETLRTQQRVYEIRKQTGGDNARDQVIHKIPLRAFRTLSQMPSTKSGRSSRPPHKERQPLFCSISASTTSCPSARSRRARRTSRVHQCFRPPTTTSEFGERTRRRTSQESRQRKSRTVV